MAGMPDRRWSHACGRAIGVIDADDFLDLRALLACTDLDDQGRAGFERGIARRLDLPHVQEGLARSVGHLDKAEALVRIEPFHPRFGLRSRSWSAIRCLLPHGPFVRCWWSEIAPVIFGLTAKLTSAITVIISPAHQDCLLKSQVS